VDLTVLQYFTFPGLVALIGLVIKVDRAVAFQNGSMVRLVKEFEEHRQNDREDFKALHTRLDAQSNRVVQTSLD
jgi:hypothetical protein